MSSPGPLLHRAGASMRFVKSWSLGPATLPSSGYQWEASTYVPMPVPSLDSLFKPQNGVFSRKSLREPIMHLPEWTRPSENCCH